jgi:hypothetical protein
MRIDTAKARGHAAMQAFGKATEMALDNAANMLKAALQQYHEDQEAWDAYTSASELLDSARRLIAEANHVAADFRNPHAKNMMEVTE